MPMLLENIDKIARNKGRGVLFLEFHPEYHPEEDDFVKKFDSFNYESCEVRKVILKWFEENQINIKPCFNTRSDGLIHQPYMGELYIDLPYDESNSEYMKVQNYLENPDGSLKFEGIRFLHLPLEVAMQNKHHDESGYWDDF